MTIIVEKKFITDEEIYQINGVIKTSYFPFFINESTTNYFPVLTHTLLDRNDHKIVSENAFLFFKNIALRFCEKNQINVKSILRAGINCSFNCTDLEFGDLHVDHKIPHKVLIMYLNETGVEKCSTLIFDKKYDDETGENILVRENTVDQIKKSIPVLCESFPELGKVICFDGRNYHSQKFPKGNNLRYACVFTIEEI